MEDYRGNFRQGELIAAYLKGELTDQQKAELESWLAESEANRTLFAKLTHADSLQRELDRFAATDKTEAWNRIVTETGYTPHHQTTYIGSRLLKVAVAATVLIVCGLFSYRSYYKTEPIPAVAQQPADFQPGRDKAVLTLGNASRIILDDATTGEIAKEGDVVISKTADGQLLYQGAEQAGSKNELVYNTITTPRGGKFRLILPDGSKVWLNAASSLKYPARFGSAERRVELTGEAYFEVAHVKKNRTEALPFRVLTRGQVVEVLGTHFNINCYFDESNVKTTLLEGKVKVIRTQRNSVPSAVPADLVLKPGEQAQLATGRKPGLNRIQADMEEAVAWKNGQFQFKDTDLPTIMRQIARWYDVEIDFQGKLPEAKYRGKISRDVPLSQFFQILQLSGVNFTIEGRKITVKS